MTSRGTGAGAAGTPTPQGRLRALADRPAEQIAFALTLLDDPAAFLDVQAALAVVAEAQDPELRPTLLDLYAHYDADGLRLDPGGGVRADILRALRPILQSADAPLLEAAATREEWLPPGPVEVASGLRAAGLVALAYLDDELAACHAVRLLGHRHTDRMGGEPAMTAVRVLASQDRQLPLYTFVLGADSPVPEVTAECLRNLVGLPPALVADLAEGYGPEAPAPALAGLFELLVAHPAREEFRPLLAGYLAKVRDGDLYHYLVTLIAASRKAGLIEELLEAAAWEMDPPRIHALIDALSLCPGEDKVEATLDRLRSRAEDGV